MIFWREGPCQILGVKKWDCNGGGTTCALIILILMGPWNSLRFVTLFASFLASVDYRLKAGNLELCLSILETIFLDLQLKRMIVLSYRV